MNPPHVSADDGDQRQPPPRTFAHTFHKRQEDAEYIPSGLNDTGKEHNRHRRRNSSRDRDAAVAAAAAAAGGGGGGLGLGAISLNAVS